MGRRSTKTTEAHYARIRSDDAFAELEKAFAAPERVPASQGEAG